MIRQVLGVVGFVVGVGVTVVHRTGTVPVNGARWSCLTCCAASESIVNQSPGTVTGGLYANDPPHTDGECTCEVTDCTATTQCNWSVSYTVDAGAGRFLCKIPLGGGAGTNVGQTDNLVLSVTQCGGIETQAYRVKTGADCATGADWGLIRVTLTCGDCPDCN